MAGPDYPEDGQRGTGNVPSLIHDYRAQREAWREQARNLARMREDVLAAADGEAKDIVSAARADIRQILLKARRDLLVLAAQVRAAGRLGDGEDNDLGQAHDALTSARHDVRSVLDESRPELEGLASEGEALRAALRHQRPVGPAPAELHRQIARPALEDTFDAEPARPVDFEFMSLAAEESPDPVVNRSRVRRPFRTLLTAAASIGAVALMGTAFLIYGPLAGTKGTSTQAVESGSSTTSNSSARAAEPTPTASAAVDSGSTSASDASAFRTTVPESRLPASGTGTPLSVQLAVQRADAWIRVTADGRVTAARTFKPGETEQISAAREISVLAGNAGAVTVSVDGRPPVAMGRDGKVVERRFTVEAQGVQPPAPPSAAPATPSPSVPVAQSPTDRPTVPNPLPSAAASTSTTPRPIEQQTPAASAPPTPASPSFSNAAAKASAAPGDRPAPAASSPVSAQTSLQESLTNVASRWLDAYYRQDRAMMTAIAPQANVSDDRGDKERLPGGLNGVRRSFDDVNFRVSGSEAMLTARMTERMDNAAAGQMAQAVSFIAHTWTQRNGAWQLYDVRIVSASALGRALRR